MPGPDKTQAGGCESPHRVSDQICNFGRAPGHEPLMHLVGDPVESRQQHGQPGDIDPHPMPARPGKPSQKQGGLCNSAASTP